MISFRGPEGPEVLCYTSDNVAEIQLDTLYSKFITLLHWPQPHNNTKGARKLKIRNLTLSTKIFQILFMRESSVRHSTRAANDWGYIGGKEHGDR